MDAFRERMEQGRQRILRSDDAELVRRRLFEVASLLLLAAAITTLEWLSYNRRITV